MKPQINILVIVFFLAIGMHCFGQEKHIITLYVNTAEIKKPNMNNYCHFGESQEDQSVSVEDYTVFVENNDFIEWNGVSTSSELDSVSIVSINYHGGKNILGKNVIKGRNGVVNAQVKRAEAGDEEKYVIYFWVYNNGTKRNGKFQIDPKLRVKE